MRHQGLRVLLFLLLARTASGAGLDDAVQKAKASPPAATGKAVIEKFMKEVGGKLKDAQKRIFDYETKIKEMEERIEVARKTAEEVYTMTRALKDLLWSTSGYRYEVARQPLIEAAGGMLQAASPIQGIMFASEAGMITDFLDMKKEEAPVDWIGRAAKMMEVRVQQMADELQKPANEKFIQGMDQICSVFGTSWEEVAAIYEKEGEKGILAVAKALLEQEKVRDALKDLGEKAKEFLKEGEKEGEYKDELEQKAKALEKAKDEKAKKVASLAEAQRKANALDQKRQQLQANLKAQVPGWERISKLLETVIEEWRKALMEVEHAEEEVEKAKEAVSKAADEWIEARRKLELAGDVKAMVDKTKATGSAVLDAAGLPPARLRKLIQLAEKETQKVQRTIALLQRQRQRIQAILDLANSFREVGRGFVRMGQKFRSFMPDISTVYQTLKTGRIPLESLRSFEASATSLVAAEFSGFPTKIAAAFRRVKDIDIEKLDQIFSAKIGEALEPIDRIGWDKLSSLKKRLQTHGQTYGKMFRTFDRFNVFVKGVQAKITHLEGLWGKGSAELEKILQSMDLNKEYDRLLGEWSDKAKGWAKEKVEKIVKITTLEKIAKYMASVISKWDLVEPTLEWVSPGPNDTIYYHEQMVRLFLLAKDDNSGVNPDPRLWSFEIDGKKHEDGKELKALDFEAEEKDEFYFLETRHKKCHPIVQIKAPAGGDSGDWHKLKGYVRDRAGHASETLEQRFRLIYDPTPPVIEILAPRPNKQAAKPGSPVEVRVRLSDDVSRVRKRDIVVAVTSVKTPDKYWDFWGTDSRVSFKPLRVASTTDDSFTEVEISLSLPSDLEEGVYLLTVRAMNGAGDRSGMDGTFFLGEGFEDIVITPHFTPANLAFLPGESFELRFEAMNSGLVPIAGIRIAPDPGMPAGAPFEKTHGPKVLEIEKLGPPGERDGEKIRAVRRTEEFEAYKVSDKAEAGKHPFRYTVIVDEEGGKSRDPEKLEVPVLTETKTGPRTRVVRGHLYFETVKAGKSKFFPVPRGTELRLSQIFQIPTFAGDLPKHVEQFVGYGHILDEKGFFSIEATLELQTPLRCRLVADAMAYDLAFEDPEKKVGKRVIAGIISPQYSRPYRCITEAFHLPDASRDGRGFLIHDVDRKELPYHSLAQDVKQRPKRGGGRFGISIQWEGELSTAGFINPYGARVTGDLIHANELRIQANTLGEKMYPEACAGIVEDHPGIWWHNRTESLFILSEVVRGYGFAQKMIREFDRIPEYATEGTFIPVLTSEYEPPPPPSEDIPDPEKEEEEEKTPVEPIVPEDPPSVAPPPEEPRDITVPVTVIAEEKAGRVKATYQMGMGQHWIYQPDEPGFAPTAVRHLDDERFLILDGGKNRILIVDFLHKVEWEFSRGSDEDGLEYDLAHPRGIDALEDGSVLVADTGHDRVLEIDRSSKVLWSFPAPDQPDTPLKGPTEVDRLMDGTTRILDAGNQRLVEVDASGAITRVLGAAEGIVDPVAYYRESQASDYWVGERSGRLLELDQEGKILKKIVDIQMFDPTAKKEVPGKLGRPAGLLVDVHENVFVCQPDSREAVALDIQSRLIDRYEALEEPVDLDRYDYELPRLKPEILDIPLEDIARYNPPESEIIVDVDPWKSEEQQEAIEDLEEKRQKKAREKVELVMKIDLGKEKRSVPVRGPSHAIDIGGAVVVYPFEQGLKDIAVTYPHYYGHPRGKTGERRQALYIDRENALDSDLILRGYGAYVRQHVLERLDILPRYRLAARHPSSTDGLRDAWYQGWDHFFSFAVRESLEMPSIEIKDRGALTLEGVLDRYRSRILLDDPSGQYAWLDELREQPYRGMNNELAWALMLHKLHQDHGSPFLTNLRTYAMNAGSHGHLYRYMPVGILSEVYRDNLEDFLALGLLPAVKIALPSTPETLGAPASPKFRWDANGLLGETGDLSFTLQYDRTIDFLEPRSVPIPATTTGEFDMGSILSETEFQTKLENRLQEGTWYFRVVCDSVAFPNVGARHGVSSSIGRIRFEIPSTAVGTAGGDVAFGGAGGVEGTVSIPPGAVKGETKVTQDAVKVAAGAGAEPIVGDHVFDFGPHGIQFEEKVGLKFDVDKEKLKGLDPGQLVVKRWSEDLHKWVSVPTEVDPDQGKVEGKTDTFSVYALMVDLLDPEVEKLDDGPDPLGLPGESSLVRVRSSEEGSVGAEIRGTDGKLIRQISNSTPLEDFEREFVWDLTDDSGKRVPDGNYRFVVRVRDLAGHESGERSTLVHVGSRLTSTLAGQVHLQDRDDHAGARVSVLETTRSGATAADGGFHIDRLTPGAYVLRVERDGFFPVTTGPVEVGARSALGSPIELVHRIVREIRHDPEVPRPSPEDEEPVILHYTLDRGARVGIEIFTEHGESVRRLVEDEEQGPGPHQIVWDLKDARQDLVPGGRYRLRGTARIDEVTLPQFEHEIRVDRGIAREVVAIPAVFSPNDDGFEDRTEILYRLSHEAFVTVGIEDGQGGPVLDLVHEQLSKPGPYADLWNGMDAAGRPVPDGPYRYRIRSRYLDGLESRTVTGSLLVDRVPPRIDRMTPVNGSRLTTGMPEITAVVSGSPGDVTTASIQLKIDEHTVPVDHFDPATGVARYRPRTSLGPGVHIAILYARDAAGNSAMPGAVSFSIEFPGEPVPGEEPGPYRDDVAPGIRFTLPGKEETVYSASPLFACRLFDERSGVDPETLAVYLDGDKVANQVSYFIPGRTGEDWDWWTYQRAVVLFDPLEGWLRFRPMQSIPEGKGWHDVRFEAMDRRGNRVVSDLVRFRVVLDGKPPRIQDLSPAEGWIGHETSVTVRAVILDEGDSGVSPVGIRLAIDGLPVPLEEFEFDPASGALQYRAATLGLEDRQHLVSLVAYDRAGNASAEAHSTFLTRPDSEAPVLLSSDPVDGGRVPASRSTLRLRLADPGPAGLDPASLRLELDGRAVSPGPEGSSWTAEGKGDRIARVEVAGAGGAGSHTLSVAVADRAGNKLARELLTWWASDDEKSPEILEFSPQHAAHVGLHSVHFEARVSDAGDGIDPGGFELNLDGHAVGLAGARFDETTGRFQLTHIPASPLDPSVPHILSLVVKDRAGNRSAARVSVVEAVGR